jgi:hypothetical protein
VCLLFEKIFTLKEWKKRQCDKMKIAYKIKNSKIIGVARTSAAIIAARNRSKKVII